MKIDFKIISGYIIIAGILVMLIALILSAGCITKSKEAFNFLDSLTGTPYPTPVPTIAVPVITQNLTVVNISANTGKIRVLETETLYDLMNRTNGRYEGTFLSFWRNNVDGDKDLLIFTSVYGHKLCDNYSVWSVSWADYFTETPKPGMKFLFVYVVLWVDIDMGDDVRPYGFDQDHFTVQYQGAVYHPYKFYSPEFRVKEMENVYTYNHASRIGPYGYSDYYQSSSGTTIDSLGWIKGGESNAWDGFIVYEIPQSAVSDDIRVIARFEDLAGWSWWQLK